jgi:small subunit ribosomal protein S16
MPVRLRLSLHGNRNNRIFHLVAVDARKRRDAKPIELLGIYNPRLRLDGPQEHKTMQWSVERIMYWLQKGGALPSKPVVKLLEWVRHVNPPPPPLHISFLLSLPRSEAIGVK